MFERFTKTARDIVVGAQEGAVALRHDHIGTEHLILAIANHPGSVAAGALAQRGLSRDAIERAIRDLAAPKDGLDADALSDLGIDLDTVRERVEANFGPGALERGHRKGHLPFSKAAKKSLELALREAIRLGEKAIDDRHLLLGVLREGVGSGYRIVVDAGVDIAALRAELDAGGTAQTA